MSEITTLKNKLEELAVIIPDLIKALEDLYISITDIIVEEDEPTEEEKKILEERKHEETISWDEAIEKIKRKTR